MIRVIEDTPKAGYPLGWIALRLLVIRSTWSYRSEVFATSLNVLQQTINMQQPDHT